MGAQHRLNSPRSRPLAVALLGGGALLAATVISAAGLLDATDAQRSSEQHITTEFTANVFDMEASADGSTWADGGPGEEIQLAFDPDSMALQVGRDLAVYEAIGVRMKQGSVVGSQATTVSAHINDAAAAASGFGQALRANAYVVEDTNSCSADGVDAGTELATISGAEEVLTTLNVGSFALPGATAESPGEPALICLELWLDNNLWLIGQGTPPSTVTVDWAVTGQLDAQRRDQ